MLLGEIAAGFGKMCGLETWLERGLGLEGEMYMQVCWFVRGCCETLGLEWGWYWELGSVAWHACDIVSYEVAVARLSRWFWGLIGGVVDMEGRNEANT